MKLGVLLRDLGPSQLAYGVIKKLNEALASGQLRDAAAFFEEPAPPCLQPRFACMQLAEAWAFDGAVVATTLSGARKLVRFPSAARSFFYVWDLEWVRRPGVPYEELRSTYCDPSLRLVARSVEHAAVIRSCWGRDCLISEDFDLAAFIG